jgi:LPXTG-motif cell wall-anchored protein
MRKLGTIFLAGCFIILSGSLIPATGTDDWNQKERLTFEHPFEVPGGTVLPAGTYVFRVADSQGDRHIVQIFSENQQELLATLHAIPDFRANAEGQPSITFERRTADGPVALMKWFYPDRRVGHQFVYPKTEPQQMARVTEPSRPMESSISQQPIQQPAEPEPEYAVSTEHSNPEPEEGQATERSETTSTSEMAMQERREPEQTPGESSIPATLPRTGSSLPFAALAGILLLAGSAAIRLYRRRLE